MTLLHPITSRRVRWFVIATVFGLSFVVAGFMTIGILGGIVSTSIVPPLVKHYGYGGWIAAFGSGTAMGIFSAVLWWVLGKRLAKP